MIGKVLVRYEGNSTPIEFKGSDMDPRTERNLRIWVGQFLDDVDMAQGAVSVEIVADYTPEAESSRQRSRLLSGGSMVVPE